MRYGKTSQIGQVCDQKSVYKAGLYYSGELIYIVSEDFQGVRFNCIGNTCIWQMRANKSNYEVLLSMEHRELYMPEYHTTYHTR